jgi:hypothetical protein
MARAAAAAAAALVFSVASIVVPATSLHVLAQFMFELHLVAVRLRGFAACRTAGTHQSALS